MLSALRTPSRAQAVVGVLLAALGFAAVTQMRSYEVNDSYEGYREQALIDVLNGLAGSTQRAEAELHEHWRERRSAQREKLRRAERAFEMAPPMQLDATLLETAGPMCCCCWAREGERQEMEGHTAHVW